MERTERTNGRPESDDITSSHHGGNRCSEEANATVTEFKSSQRFQVLTMIAKFSDPPVGVSSDEVERITGMKHQTCGARFTELKADGLIYRIGYGKTRSGCRCGLYVARPEVVAALKLELAEQAGKERSERNGTTL
jgi:hypothetical protein